MSFCQRNSMPKWEWMAVVYQAKLGDSGERRQSPASFWAILISNPFRAARQMTAPSTGVLLQSLRCERPLALWPLFPRIQSENGSFREVGGERGETFRDGQRGLRVFRRVQRSGEIAAHSGVPSRMNWQPGWSAR